LAFPDNCDTPTQSAQFIHDTMVAGNVGIKFFFPKKLPRGGHRSFLAPGMPMPKTAVDKHCNAPSRED
jgi:hypothetical protein